MLRNLELTSLGSLSDIGLTNGRYGQISAGCDIVVFVTKGVPFDEFLKDISPRNACVTPNDAFVAFRNLHLKTRTCNKTLAPQ
jgi:hypothetical protein